MGLFKVRNNKKFEYTPRHYKDNGAGNPYRIGSKFDEYRKTIENPKGIKGKFVNALDDLKNSPGGDTNKRVLIIAIVLFLIFLFLIDFDLSIFFRK